MTLVVRQRAEGDCGVAALAMIAETTYEDAYVAVAKSDRHFRGKSGLLNQELVVAARKLGVALTPTKRFDLDDDEGVLRVRFPSKRHGGHFVAVRHGLILCPSYLELLPWRDYMERNQARPCTLLRMA